ncbi:MAG: LptA/OstA family protein, partial [Pyrinomonadaceae bacterium]
MANANLQKAHITAGHATVEQLAEKIYLEQNVNINLQPKTAQGNFSQPTDIHAEKVTAYFTNKEINKLEMAENVETFQKPTAQNPKYTNTRSDNAVATFEKELKNLQLGGNVEIETTNNTSKPTKIKSQQAVYDKPSDNFDLKTNVEIVTVEDEKPTTIHAQEANYLQTSGQISLNGGAEILQPDIYTKGDQMTAELYPTKKLKNSFVRGNAYVKQTTPDRTTEISAGEMSVNYNENQQIQNADAKNQTTVTLTPARPQDYNKVTMFAPIAAHLTFASGLLNQMQTDGRTAIVMSAPPNKNDASNKKLTADTVKTFFNADGKNLSRTEAVGNAELYVEPLQAKADNYKTTVTAPRFDCDFYEGNNAKTCVAATKAKAVLVPMIATENHGTRTLTADKLTTNFNQGTQDVERFDADGSAKFSELDRNGISNQMIYTASDGIVKLRGGEPTVWNAQARAKAGEIDWDTKNQKSFLRGKVSTTYYSQKQTNGATPFGKTNAPVFVTADQAQFNHAEAVGIYQGNARAWQENNYVRADTLTLQEKSRRMDGEGKVQSLLYNAERKENGKTVNQPVFAASDKISYTDENRQLRYENNVDIRQGTDRITAGLADIFLDENNEMKQTVAQNNVVMTQPNRRVTGSWVQYTSADETAILRGNPATVADAENGTTQGSQLTFLMRENRIINQGSTKSNTSGRTRTTYKVKPQ